MSRSKVDHPDHYQHGGKETIYVIRDALDDDQFMGFLAGCIIKYVTRYPYKGGVEDLQKAQWYLDWMIRELTT